MRLHTIHHTSERPLLSIVFIHGVDGHWKQTWSRTNEEQDFWPRWLIDDFPLVNIYSIDYPASTFIFCNPVYDFHGLSQSIFSHFQTVKLVGPIVFIYHSLGGIVAKQFFVDICSHIKNPLNSINYNIVGMYFIATPHCGTKIANILNRFGLFFGRRGPAVFLREKNIGLLKISETFLKLQFVCNLKIECAYENKKYVFLLILPNKTSILNIIGVENIRVDKNHSAICKLENRDDIIYARIKLFLNQCRAATSSDNLDLLGTYSEKFLDS